MENVFTSFDLIVLVLCLASGIHVLLRGFMRELLSLISWVGAFFLTLRFAFPLAELAGSVYLIPSGFNFPFWFVMAVISVLLAFASFYLLSLVSRTLIHSVQLPDLGLVDRAAGFCFGIIRGLVLIALFYAVYAFLVPTEDHPQWLSQARTLPIINYTLTLIQDLVGVAAVTNGGGA